LETNYGCQLHEQSIDYLVINSYNLDMPFIINSLMFEFGNLKRARRVP